MVPLRSSATPLQVTAKYGTWKMPRCFRRLAAAPGIVFVLPVSSRMTLPTRCGIHVSKQTLPGQTSWLSRMAWMAPRRKEKLPSMTSWIVPVPSSAMPPQLTVVSPGQCRIPKCLPGMAQPGIVSVLPVSSRMTLPTRCGIRVSKQTLP